MHGQNAHAYRYIYYDIRPLTDLLTRHIRQSLRPSRRGKKINHRKSNQQRPSKGFKKSYPSLHRLQGEERQWFRQIHIIRSFPCPGVVAPPKGEISDYPGRYLSEIKSSFLLETTWP